MATCYMLKDGLCLVLLTRPLYPTLLSCQSRCHPRYRASLELYSLPDVTQAHGCWKGVAEGDDNQQAGLCEAEHILAVNDRSPVTPRLDCGEAT